MVIDNQMVEMKWHPRNKQYYTDLGYIYTKIGDKFEVKVEHLTKGAKSLVDVRCDYCGKIIKVKYQNYINRYSPTLKDACTQCKTKKAIDSNLNRYGVSNVFELEDIKSKSKNTFLEKYGVDHYSKSTDFKNVVPNKIRKTLYRNGTVPISSQQLNIYDLLKTKYKECFINYPCGSCSLDCLVKEKGVSIDIEYDGNYWHQDKQKDRKRDEFIKSQGYKILRIKSDRNIPTLKQLVKAINCLVKSNHSYKEIRL